MQALQFVFEEKVMTMEIPAPPLLMIGMEGVWGTFLCVAVLYPLAYYLPGDDHGSYENFENTLALIKSSPAIQISFIVYFFVIFGYNVFAALVTFLLNSVWHAILDNFRPITVWVTDLFIFYVIVQTGDLGEPWTKWSFVQLTGMFVLFYGTAGKLLGSISLGVCTLGCCCSLESVSYFFSSQCAQSTTPRILDLSNWKANGGP